MLQERAEDLARGFSGTLGLVVEGRERVSINESHAFPAASIIKVPLMVEVFRQAREGRFSLADTRRYDGPIVGGSGFLEVLHAGVELTIEDYVRFMICVSDNAATNVLFDLVGKDEVNATMREMGLSGTVLNRKMMDYASGTQNYTTPHDMAHLLDLIVRKKILDEASCDLMLAILKKQQIMGGITFLLPEMEIGWKTGELEHSFHDVGVVYGKTTYLFSGFTTDVEDIGEARRLLASLSRAVFEVLG